MLIVADPPMLVVGERIVWLVPAWIGFPSMGRADDVGFVDVDVQTGEMLQLDQAEEKIKACASAIAQKLPPFRPRKVAKAFIPEHIPPAPILVVD
jgi:hypothetical protein